MKNPNIVTVWSWMFGGMLCRWAEPKPLFLAENNKPCADAKKVKCIMMTYGEYLKLKKGKK